MRQNICRGCFAVERTQMIEVVMRQAQYRDAIC